MSLFTRPERRAVSYQDVWGSGGPWPPTGGTAVTVEQAIGVAAVFSCVDLLAGSIAAMPLHAFRDQDGVKERVSPGPRLVNDPSQVLAPDEWVYAAVASLLLAGNAYGFVMAESGGWPSQVEWQNPASVSVDEERGRVKYTVAGVPVPAERMVHVRHGLIRPGHLLGYSPIQKLPVPIKTAVEAARYEMGWFTDGAHPSAVLATDQPVNQDQARTIKDRFMEALRGRREPVVLGAGVRYQSVQAGPAESASTTVKQAIATEVANAFHVPPELVGGSAGGSMTYQNVEAWQRNLEVRALLPVYTRLERALSRHMPRPVYCRFNADAVIRVATVDRFRAHGDALRSGWKSRNEIRRLEDLPPIEGGDEYLWPPYRAFPLPEESGAPTADGGVG